MPKTENLPVTTHNKGVMACVLISISVLALYHIPYGNLILYPFSLVFTFIHEMGHGITAILVGGQFKDFVMSLDGSGLASAMVPSSRFAMAAYAAGGLLAPPIVAAICLFISKNPKLSRITWYAFAAICVISIVLVVRNTFGIFFVALCGVASFALAKFPKTDAIPRYAMLVLAITQLTSVFARGDYLFVKYASGDSMNPATQQLSDVGAIAEQLFLPYWFWGGLIAIFSIIILILGIRAFFRSPKTQSKALPSNG